MDLLFTEIISFFSGETDYYHEGSCSRSSVGEIYDNIVSGIISFLSEENNYYYEGNCSRSFLSEIYSNVVFFYVADSCVNFIKKRKKISGRIVFLDTEMLKLIEDGNTGLKNTEKINNWVRNMFDVWRLYEAEVNGENMRMKERLEEVEFVVMFQWLFRFLFQIRKKDGEYFLSIILDGIFKVIQRI